MAFSLAPTKRTNEFLVTFSGYLIFQWLSTKNAIKLIKTMTESCHEHLNPYKILFLFNDLLKSYSWLYFATFPMKSILHIATSLALQKCIQFLAIFNKLSLKHHLDHKCQEHIENWKEVFKADDVIVTSQLMTSYRKLTLLKKK